MTAGAEPSDVQLVARLATDLGHAREPIEAYRALLAFARRTTPTNGFFIARYDEATRMRTCVFSYSDGVECDPSELPPLPLNGSPNARAILTRRPVLVDDYQAAVQGVPVTHIALQVNPDLPRSSLAVPMIARDRVVGVLTIQSTKAGAFGEGDVPYLQTAANLAALALENLALLEARERALADATQELRGHAVARDLVRRMLRRVSLQGEARPGTLRALGRELAAGLRDPALDEALRAYAAMGMGRVQPRVAGSPRYEFEARDLLEREEESPQPTCFLALGFLEGVVARVESGGALGTEIRCQSRGHEACRFVVVARPGPTPP